MDFNTLHYNCDFIYKKTVKSAISRNSDQDPSGEFTANRSAFLSLLTLGKNIIIQRLLRSIVLMSLVLY